MVKDTGRSARESSLASGWTVEGEATPEPEALTQLDVTEAIDHTDPGDIAEGDATESTDESDGATRQLSNAAMVLLGIIGGVYLLYTVVWFSWASAYASRSAVFAESSGSIGSVLEVAIVWIAPIAPAAWLFTLLLQLREMKFSRIVLWLIIGLVVLVPLPLLILPGVYTGGQ
ncbi:MAG: hypothetical protein GX814_08130 [Microbacteriaceae bacterium]|nr:hypothetical protein [Microbacteriaceae bacterium]